ncbi:MAG: DNA/RNA nuclease SfsA, partial [Anaerolineae bacterium]|nr:DNA/RNA nuclease SfsA [Anaerolineae bacterium]
MEYPPLLPARFLRRDNRFRALVEVSGSPASAYVPNSGRLGELLVVGAPVWVRSMAASNRKTMYDLCLVEHAGVLVSIDARLPPRLLAEVWEAGRLEELSGYDVLEREVQVGGSRLDLRLRRDETVCWIEAKSVTLVRDGLALFPDA